MLASSCTALRRCDTPVCVDGAKRTVLARTGIECGSLTIVGTSSVKWSCDPGSTPDGEKLLTLQAKDFLGEGALSVRGATGQEFFFITPGIMRLNYPNRKGGGSFIWAGPELHGNGVVQIIGMERNSGGRHKSVIEMGADFQGNGSISLRKHLSDDPILVLGADHRAQRDVDPKEWEMLGGRVEFYSKEGYVGSITSGMLEQ